MARQLRRMPAAALAAALLGVSGAAFGQTGKTVVKDDAWQKAYDDRLARWQAAEDAYQKVQSRIADLPGGIKNATSQLKSELDKATRERAQLTRELELFLRRAPLRRRPLLADLYLQRARSAQNPLEATAALGQAEAVLRSGAEYFRSAWQAIPADEENRKEYRFDLRVLSIRARRALADHLVDNIIYPALDEYEVFNQQNAVVKGTVSAIDEAIASYRIARDELDDLIGDARDNLQRLRLQAELDGFAQAMKIAQAWQMYYRAWLTPPPRESKSAAAQQRRKDLDTAYDVFQDTMNDKRSASDAVRLTAHLGYALVVREQEQRSAAADELRKLANAPELTGTKVQATWELARTLMQMRRFEEAVGVCDLLDKMEKEAQARDMEINKAQESGKDGPEPYPARFYTRWAPAMRLQILYAWKNSKEHPTRGKAEAAFQKAAESLKNREDNYLWGVIVDSMNRRRWKEIVKNPEAPNEAELKELTSAERLMLGRQFLDDQKLETAKTYLDAVLADSGFTNDPANRAKVPELHFDIAKIHFNLYDREKKAATGDNKPSTTHIVAALEIVRRLTKEFPDSEAGKLAFQAIPAVMKEIATTFPDEAESILRDDRIDFLEKQLSKEPNHPAADSRRLALANEYEKRGEKAYRAMSGLTGKEREKAAAEVRQFESKAIARLLEVKPNKPEYVYARVHVAELKYRELYREETSAKAKVDPAKIRQVAQLLEEAGEIALTDWKKWPADKQPTEAQVKKSRRVAADFLTGAAELFCRPAVNDLKRADDLIRKYEKVFHEGAAPETLAEDWESDGLRVRRRAMQIFYNQTTGKAKEAEDLIFEFLTKEKAEITNRYMSKLFAQTRRLIDDAENKGNPKQAVELSKQLVALGERLLPMLPPAEREGPRGLAIRELIVEMQIKSGDAALAQKALDKAEDVLKSDPKNGQWQVYKCEALTRLAAAAGEDKAKWANVCAEWKKLTADRDMIQKEEYRNFFWQSWWYLLACRHEMSLWEVGTEKKKIQDEVKTAFKNLIGIYRQPPDNWTGRFDDLRAAMDEDVSALKFLKR